MYLAEIVFFIFYSLIINVFILGFVSLKQFKKNESSYTGKENISVVIPFKNEENNLGQLVKNLRNQSLDYKYFEIIFVNDNSEDKSEDILYNLIKNIPNFKLINSPKNGKKEAIKEGIKKSYSNLIVTTDADCIHQKYWLETILSCRKKHKPKMIIAPVLMKGKGIFGKLQALDFLGLAASTAGSCGIKRPVMCNGANLIYEKEVFYEFEDILNSEEVSGDDMFLMHSIKKKYRSDIYYLKSNNAVVYTEAETNLKSFFRQRIRWASKSKSYKDFDTVFLSLIVFGVNILLIFASLLAIFEAIKPNTLLSLFMLKFIPEIILLSVAGNYFKQKDILFLIPVLSFIHPLYIIYTAIAGVTVKKVKWK